MTANSYEASLDLRVTSSGVDSADKGLKGIERSGKRAERATDGVSAAFTRLIGPVAAFISVSAGLKKVTEVTRQFQVFKASLETATGSATAATTAFTALEDFAKTTPFALEQSVEAFVTLTNLGLTPSEKALRSYGNTAAAMGKDLQQFIEAVADASTNEFERLKEFGIKASQQGDQVAFTFRGVTTTVGKNADEIEKYLIGIGETDFAGAMEKRMDTLDGAISNLGDTWDGLFRSVGDQGLGDLITEGVETATAAIEELDSMLKSGQLEQSIVAITTAFEGWGRDVANAMDAVEDIFNDHAESIGASGKSLTEFLSSSMKNLPANVRALVQIMTVELASFIDKTAAYGTEILENIQFWKDETFDLDAELGKIDQTRLSSIDVILKERDTAVKSVDLQIKKASDLRDAYDEALKSKKKATLDDAVNQSPTLTKTGDPTTKTPNASQKKEFQDLIDNVIPPEDRINEVFQKRLELIQANTEAGSAKQAELIGRLNDKYATDVLDGFETEPGEYDFSAQIDKVNEEYEARRSVILANTQLTEEQRTALEEQLAISRNQKLEGIEKARWSAISSVAQGALGNLATLMNSGSKKAFKIGKIAAIANATIAGIESTIHSYRFGAQIGGPVLGAAFAATAAAATLVQIQQLKAQNFGGGGTVSAVGSASPSTNVYQPPQPTQGVGPNQEGANGANTYQVIFNGDVSGVDSETIAEMLKEHMDSTDFILFESASAQGQELAA